jgi:hypothetical protein
LKGTTDYSVPNNVTYLLFLFWLKLYGRTQRAVDFSSSLESKLGMGQDKKNCLGLDQDPRISLGLDKMRKSVLVVIFTLLGGLDLIVWS